MIKKFLLLSMMAIIPFFFTNCPGGKDTEEKADNGPLFVMLMILTNQPAKVRFFNNSGATEIYSVYSSAGCGGAAVMNWGTTLNGATTDYYVINPGTYYIGDQTSATKWCLTSPTTFKGSSTNKCTSGAVTVTCATE